MTTVHNLEDVWDKPFVLSFCIAHTLNTYFSWWDMQKTKRAKRELPGKCSSMTDVIYLEGDQMATAKN